MSLDTRNRPDSLQQVSGNKSAIVALNNLFEKEYFPHALLITGPTGCGKTTFGRIVANMLGAHEDDYREVDSAQFNGIDTVREIKGQMRFGPRHPSSDCRVWLIDECFPAGTKIKTPDGERNIEDLEPDDSVFSLNGSDKVVAKMLKDIPLERLIKLNFGNKTIITTRDHLFFTDYGWISAELLNKKHLIYSYNTYNMERISSGNNTIGGKNENPIEMPAMRNNPGREGKMEQAKILFKGLFRRLFEPAPRNKSRVTFEGVKSQGEKINKKSLAGDGSGNQSKAGKRFFKKDESQQPVSLQKKHRENEGNEKNERDTECLARGKRREWPFNRATKAFISCFGVGNRGGNIPGGSSTIRAKKKIHNSPKVADLLQSGRREQETENWYRDRWEESRIEEKYIKRSEENYCTERVRLVDSEVYERGDNEQSFESVIGDQERSSGFVKMYDLQVANHPSYFVDDLPVHNCHMLGTGGASEKNKAQNAILKMLEDAPEHVYFILCTTDPQRLLKTVVGRCVEISVGTITDKEMSTLLKKVCRKEGEKILDEVRAMIVDRANGHPRNALKLLEKVIGLDEDTALDLLEQEEQKEEQAIKLARALIGGSPWKVISGILKGLKDQDEEGIRRMLLSYCSSILLKGSENPQAFVVMEEMEEPFYNTGKPGLTLACYRATVDIDGSNSGDVVPF